MEYLLAQYMAAGVLRGAAAVMSLELLGNPGGLIQEIWAGVRDALTLPLTVSLLLTSSDLPCLSFPFFSYFYFLGDLIFLLEGSGTRFAY